MREEKMKYKITHKQTKTLPDTLRYNDWIFGIFLDVPLYFTVFDRDDMWHKSQGECWWSPRFGFSSPVLRSYYTLEGGSKVLKHNIHCLFDLEWSKTNSPQLQSIALLTVWSISSYRLSHTGSYCTLNTEVSKSTNTPLITGATTV